MPGAAAELRRISSALSALPRDWAKESAKTVRKAATKTLTADTGGDRSLSRAPGKLNVRTSVRGSSTVTLAVVPGPKRFGAGRWAWLEHGTERHFQPRRQAMHPGSEGKRTWSRAVDPQERVLINDARYRFSVAVRGF